MKYKLRVFIVALIAIFLVACTKDNKPQETNPKETVPETKETNDETTSTESIDATQATETTEVTKSSESNETKVTEEGKEGTSYGSAKDYISFEENVKYHYEGKGNEYATFDIYVDYIADNKIQFRWDSGGTQSIQVIDKKDNKLLETLFRAESYYRENLTSKANEKEEILLVDPVQKGTTWQLSGNSRRTITDVEVVITTPIGDFTTIEVTKEDNGEKILEYYAKGTGLVKRVFKSEGEEVSSTLSKIEKNVTFPQSVSFYYPSKDLNNLLVVDREISFKSNDITRFILEKEYKKLDKDNISAVLSEKAKINSLYLQDDNVVYIDLSKEFVEDMNAGSSYESLILQSIANTFATYYGVKEVYLTVDNKPYESGHYSFKKGEKIKVNTDNVLE